MKLIRFIDMVKLKGSVTPIVSTAAAFTAKDINNVSLGSASPPLDPLGLVEFLWHNLFFFAQIKLTVNVKMAPAHGYDPCSTRINSAPVAPASSTGMFR